jgi:glycosyltransferase involved in cell wall biosynthesis
VTAAPVTWVLVGDLSRSGVPVVLERLLGALDPTERSGVRVVAGRGGPVAEDLRALGVPVVELGPARGRTGPGAVAAALRTAGAAGAARRVDRAHGHRAVRSLPVPDVVVVHGAGAVGLVDLAPSSVPLVVHLHELDTGLARSGDPAVVRAALARAAVVMAVAGPTADLARRAGAGPGRIHVVPGVVRPLPPGARAAARARARTELGRGDVDLVGGAGVPSWRKGTGRLPAVAAELARRRPGAEVWWVGGRPTGAEADRVGVPDGVHWVDERPDPWDVLDAADVVVVPSREDPLPLVALEAGGRGVPVVATATGGLPDLLADGRGTVVGTHDLPALVDAVEAALADPVAAAARAEALQAHVAAHHDPAVVAPAWWSLVTGAAGR